MVLKLGLGLLQMTENNYSGALWSAPTKNTG